MSVIKKVRKDQSEMWGITDLVELILTYLTQVELNRVNGVCRMWHLCYRRAKHFKCYIVTSEIGAAYAQQQRSLKALVINNISLFPAQFRSLPEYVFIGHRSTIFIPRKFISCVFPEVRVLCIEEVGFIDINWRAFPNLQELYVLGRHTHLSIDTLDQCPLLTKLIIATQYGSVCLDKDLTFQYLQVLALNNPRISQIWSPVLYTRCTGGEEFEIVRGLLNKHHRAPKIVTDTINNHLRSKYISS
jgi:hypothetical protein